MKKFNEINGYGTIRCEAKVSTDKLKELHYKANDIIYKYNMQYAFPRNTQKAIDELSDVFVQIKELEVADAAKVKKEELLKQGRNIVTLLKVHIKSFKYDDSCVSCIESMCKFQLSKYLKSQNTLNIDSGVQLLVDNVMLRDIANDVAANLNRQPNIKAFLRMQGEIIDIISGELQTFQFK